MSDHSNHDSHNHHDHSHGVKSLSSVFFVAIALNVAFTAIEAIFGLHIHSLALLSDAGHNAMDVLNLVLSGMALWASKVKSTETFTYGYKRASVFAAFVNSILLVVTALYIIYEAFVRLSQPVETVWSTMMAVAGVGIFINGLSGWLLMRGNKEDINVKSAYLHLLGDALVSLGVVIGWAIIYFTGYVAIDPVISIIVSVIMIVSVVDLLKKSILMNFDGVPAGLDVSEIKKDLAKIPWVQGIHHVHVWSLSTTENAITAHVVTEKWADTKKIKNEVRHELLHKNIHHVTIEIEYEACEEGHCD